MNIDKILEALNKALSDKDWTIWSQNEEIKRLKQQIKELQGDENNQ